MALRIRRGLSADRTSITPEQGEFLYTTDTYQVYMGDGVTAGGRPLYTLTSLGAIGLTDLSALSPLSYNNTTGAFSIQVATGSQDGYLSSANWTTFNSKQNSLEIFDETTSLITNPSQIKFVGTPVTATVAGSVVTVTISGTGGGGGGVTGVSVATANGLSGVSDLNATNPTLTLSTTVTGLLKGNGTAISAATAGTDYQAALTGTGLVASSGGTISYVANNSSDWNTAYSQRLSSLTTTGNSGAATLIGNVLNVPNYTAAGIGAIAATRTIATTTPLQGGGDLSADRTLSILQASSTQDGYLSSANWVTFNGKQNALSGTGIVKSTAGTITYLTDNSSNWDTAFGWGNHASAGYLLSSTAASTYTPQTRNLTIDGVTQNLTADRTFTINKALNDLTDVTTSSVLGGDLLQYNGATSQWVNVSLSALITIGADNGLSFSGGTVILGGELDNATTINTYNTTTTTQHSLAFTAGSTAFTSPGTAPLRVTDTTAYAAGRSTFYVGANDNHAIVVEGKGVPVTTAPTILYRFTITSATVVVADTYTNNGQTFTIIAGGTGTTIFASSSGVPTNTGTLTLSSGTGPATLTFSYNEVVKSAYNRTTANLTKNASLFAKSKQGIGLYVCAQPDETFSHSTTYTATQIPATLIEKTTGARTFADSLNSVYNLLALRLTDNSVGNFTNNPGLSITFETTTETTTGFSSSEVETLTELKSYWGSSGLAPKGSTFEISTKDTNKRLQPNIKIDGEANLINLPSYLSISPPITFSLGTSNITGVGCSYPYFPSPARGVFAYENRDFHAIRVVTRTGTNFAATPVIGWSVASIRVTNSGSGYVSAPAVTVTGSSVFAGGTAPSLSSGSSAAISAGTTLVATAILTGDKVTSISFTGGFRQLIKPKITIAAPPSGVTATAEVEFAAGEFLLATITNGGSGYATTDQIYVIDTRNDVSDATSTIGTFLALNNAGDIVKTQGILSLDYILNGGKVSPGTFFGGRGSLYNPSTIDALAGLTLNGTLFQNNAATNNITGNITTLSATTININGTNTTIAPSTNLNLSAGGTFSTIITGTASINYRGGYTITSDQNAGDISARGTVTISANPNATPGGERLRLNSAEKVFIFDSQTASLAGGEVFTMVNKITGEVGYTTLSTVATSGDYGDLGNLPALSTVAISNDYNDLDNLPILATVATSGDYADLTGTPTIPTTLDSLTNVNAPSPTNGQVLAYNSAGSGEWQAVTFSASGLTLRTNTVANGSQSILDLKQGTNITIVDDGVGGVTINSSGGSGGVGLDSVFMLMGA